MYSAASESMLELLMTVPNSAHYLNLQIVEGVLMMKDQRMRIMLTLTTRFAIKAKKKKKKIITQT